MGSSLKAELFTFKTICPWCNRSTVHQAQIVDLFVYVNFENPSRFVTLNKTWSNNPNNEENIKTLLINALRKKAFVSRVIFTRPLQEVKEELYNMGLLSDKDINFIQDSY